MVAIWEIDYSTVSPWWLVLIAIVAIALVVGALTLVTVPYDRRLMREASDHQARSLEASLRQEEEYLQAREEARRRAAATPSEDSHTGTVAS